MKLIMESWRKQLEEFEITGVDYEPGVAQDEPSAELPAVSAEDLLEKTIEDLKEPDPNLEVIINGVKAALRVIRGESEEPLEAASGRDSPFSQAGTFSTVMP